jgi:hypothetical protein
VRCTHNAGVEGSTPSLSTNKINSLFRVYSGMAFGCRRKFRNGMFLRHDQGFAPRGLSC